MYSNSRGSAVGCAVLLIGIVALFVLIPLACAALVSNQKAINTAEDLGYTHVRVLGKTPWFVELRGCGKDDQVRFTVQGTNPIGKVREFYVCAGIIKGGTFRSK